MQSSRLIPLLTGVALFVLGVQRLSAVPPFGVYGDASFSPTITVLESNADRVRLQLEMENLPQDQTVDFFTRLPGLWENMNTGVTVPHLLPRFSVNLALPNTGNPSVVIETWEWTAMNATSRNLLENSAPPPRAIIGNVGIMAGVRVAPLTIRPIKYTNNAAICSVMTSATISIEIDDETGQNPVTNPRTAFSRPWQQVIAATIVNWEYIPNISVGAESHMLMIVPNAYIANLADYIAWKEQRGLKITVVNENDIGANPLPSDIQARIISEVAASDPRIDYVTLVGDETQLLPYMQATQDPVSRFSDASHPEYSPYTSDNYFVAIEGSDAFPDMFVGRWVVHTTSEVAEIAAKEILHERDTFMADSTRFEHAVVSADNTELSQEETVRYVAYEMANHGIGEVDSIWAGPHGQDMINAVDAGQAFINYRGSGWSFGWWGIQFWIPEVHELNNTRKLPIVTGIGCGVGRFQDPAGQCFGEEWMLQGSVSQPKGAAGFIGPCFNTHTVYNDCLDSLLYRAILDYGIHNLQPALVAGKMMTWALMADFLDEAPVLEQMNNLIRQYLVLSDPSLQVFDDTPVRVQADIDSMSPAGLIDVPITINNMANLPADSVQVTAWMNPSDFVTRWVVQGQNQVSLQLNTQGVDTFIVTITGDNVLAFQYPVFVVPEGPFLLHNSMSLNDSPQGNGDSRVNPGESIEWTENLQNIGTEDAVNATGVLASSSQRVTITTPSASFGAVPINDFATSSSPFVFSVAADAVAREPLAFTLTFDSDNGVPQMWPVFLTVHAPLLALQSIVVADGGNGIWDRGETVGLQVTVSNDGNQDLTNATCTLTCDDSYITIVDGEETVGVMADSTNYTFAASAFQVQSAWTTPAWHVAEIALTISSDMGTYTYSIELPLELEIDEVTQADPFADSGDHFWVYDNIDTIYGEAPQYDWIEIAMLAGGPGEEIPYSSGNQTFAFPVPFDYNYYGVGYDSLSISNDGWVKPGRTTQVTPLNSAMPAVDNIPGMIAPLWFNLWRTSGGPETGQICYYYDADTDKFIVEWYHIHDITGQYQETFQLQLLNPATYPTQSGDAEWIFLYQEVSTRATSTQGATVGIENQAQNIGATYIYHGNYGAGAATLQAGRAIKFTTEPPLILATTPRELPLPTEIALAQNYPNPFNPETTIEFALPRGDVVTLSVFDVLGREVSTLVNGPVAAGQHHVTWHGQFSDGSSAASGIYFYRLSTSQAVLSRKMILLR